MQPALLNVHINQSLCLMCKLIEKYRIMCTLGKFFTLGGLTWPDVNIKYVSTTFLNFPTLGRLFLLYVPITVARFISSVISTETVSDYVIL